jgi:hypothetical protein
MNVGWSRGDKVETLWLSSGSSNDNKFVTDLQWMVHYWVLGHIIQIMIAKIGCMPFVEK